MRGLLATASVVLALVGVMAVAGVGASSSDDVRIENRIRRGDFPFSISIMTPKN